MKPDGADDQIVVLTIVLRQLIRAGIYEGVDLRVCLIAHGERTDKIEGSNLRDLGLDPFTQRGQIRKILRQRDYGNREDRQCNATEFFHYFGFLCER